MRQLTYIELRLPHWWLPWQWLSWIRMKRGQRHYRNRLRSASFEILVSSRRMDANSVEKARRIENFFYRIYDELNLHD